MAYAKCYMSFGPTFYGTHMVHLQEMGWLKKLVGEWTFSLEGSDADGVKIRGKGAIAATETAIGHGVLMLLKGEIDGIGRYEQTDLFAFFEGDSKVHDYAVSSLGMVHDHIGAWATEDKLLLEWTGKGHDQEQSERLTFEWVSPDRIVVTATDLVSGLPRADRVFVLERAETLHEEEPISVPT